MSKNYYEQRYVLETPDSFEDFFSYVNESERRILVDFLDDTDRIILLGNPGIGKSEELLQLVDLLWERKDNTGCYPIFISIKSFRTSVTIEQLINNLDLNQFPKFILIFDGLDEISNIQDFISELDLFSRRIKNLDYKILLSCRTNIYEKYITRLPDFKAVYLDSLNDKQIKSILLNKYGLEIDFDNIHKLQIYLENPFNLDLFAEYYNEKNDFPKTQQEIWDLFILNELKKTKENLRKRYIIDIFHTINCLEIVSIANELMQQNFIEEQNLLDLLGYNDKQFFEELSLIQKNSNSNTLQFRHKNFQEFFAAKYLSKLTFEEILDYIKIPKIDRIKPTLFNTLTFLLNIIENSKYELLKDWLLNNEPEQLFYAEDNRISSELKNEIFENYFKEVCIEKGFWLGISSKIPISRLANFAQLDFLIAQYTNEQIIDRARLSALNILAYKKIPQERINEVKDMLISELYKHNDHFKSEILSTIRMLKFHENDHEYFEKIKNDFKGIQSREVLHELIVMCSDKNDVDSDFTTILEIIKNYFNQTNDNVLRGTGMYVEKILLNLNDLESIAKLFMVSLNPLNDFDFDTLRKKDVEEKIIDKIKLSDNSDDFVIKIIDFVLDNELYYNEENLLTKFVNVIKNRERVLKHIIDIHGLQTKNFFLIATLIQESSIEYLIEKYQNKELNIENNRDISYLRNWIFSDNRELAREFEQKFTEIGYIFEMQLKTDNEIAISKIEIESLIENNAKIIFDKEKLKVAIDDLFNQNNIELLSWEKYSQISTKWYKETNYHWFRNSVHDLIAKALRYNRKHDLSRDQIYSLIENNLFMLSFIKDAVKGDPKKNEELKNHLSIVNELVSNLTSETNLLDIIKFNENNTYTLTSNYTALENIYYFDFNFGIQNSKEFYLKTIQFSDIRNWSNENMLDFIRLRVDDDQAFNNKIIYNIKNEKLLFSPLQKHIEHAIDYRLSDVYSKIGELLLNNPSLLSKRALQAYFELIDNNLDFLKNCCADINSNLCWNVIDIIKEKHLDTEFILSIARKYLTSEKSDYLSKALNILFYCNQDDAIRIYFNNIKEIEKNLNVRDDGFPIEDVLYYNNLNEIPILKDFFYLIYEKENQDPFYLHYARRFFEDIVAVLSSFEEGYDKIQNVFKEIRDLLSPEQLVFFYVNSILEISNNSKINNSAKNIDFEKAKKMLKG
ncbi:NACHT domain-containing protein [Chryseobacterium oleae]|uniref:NACHT domain-containing protein n=1 Tax=Chryseobacterium oleae TaxID=491207 RepID=A0A1I5CYB2_CHROL|nr:NACHT domain-containing protein [Chryseobacterium oleae]SFN91952.1 NACHT domain-containing protein [Chryseobacterium oleae]